MVVERALALCWSGPGLESDARLVAAVLGGDRAPFGELVRRHERAVRAVAFAVLADYHAAQDVAQEAFLRAFQNLDTLEDAAAFGGWVRSIARRRALSGIRRPVKVASLDAAGDVACERPAPPDADLSRSLVEAVASLPENEQAVVMLYYFDEHGVRSIAEILGRPVGTVTMQLSRARERLRGWLKEQEP